MFDVVSNMSYVEIVSEKSKAISVEPATDANEIEGFIVKKLDLEFSPLVVEPKANPGTQPPIVLVNSLIKTPDLPFIPPICDIQGTEKRDNNRRKIKAVPKKATNLTVDEIVPTNETEGNDLLNYNISSNLREEQRLLTCSTKNPFSNGKHESDTSRLEAIEMKEFQRQTTMNVEREQFLDNVAANQRERFPRINLWRIGSLCLIALLLLLLFLMLLGYLNGFKSQQLPPSASLSRQLFDLDSNFSHVKYADERDSEGKSMARIGYELSIEIMDSQYEQKSVRQLVKESFEMIDQQNLQDNLSTTTTPTSSNLNNSSD